MTRLMVASTGGHLLELTALAPRLWPPDPDELWVTFDSEQSRSLLAGRRVHYVRDTPPRDWRSVLVNMRYAAKLLRGVDTVVSNGAGIAVSFLPLARAKGISAHYIECSARVEGRSIAGRILEKARGVHLYTQYRALESSQWRYGGSSFDGYRPVELSSRAPLRSVFVTVGTLDFSFMGLLSRLQAILPDEVEVVVQAGADSERLNWPRATVRSKMSYQETESSIEHADVVIAHAGIGSALMALKAGKVPVLVPRSQSRGEHVDDHQAQIAHHLSERGLAVCADSTTIDLNDISQSLVRRVDRGDTERRFVLR